MSALFIAFLGAAALLTVTPGLDTAFVLRTAAVEGRLRAAFGAAGILLGCLAWAAAVAIGVGALITASELAYTILKWLGAAYLCWLGVSLIRRSHTFDIERSRTRGDPFVRGLVTNLLNPKVGVFYVSFLPQFVPDGAQVGPYLMFLALIHAVMGAFWFTLLIAMTQRAAAILRRKSVVQSIDRATGGIFVAFAAALALEPKS